jgi:hypothetical protein
LSGHLVRQILSALTNPGERYAHIDVANFEGARFLEDVFFDRVTFHAEAYFRNARFEGKGSFYGACFEYYASFHSATFESMADFGKSRFDQAAFKDIEFKDEVIFTEAVFEGLAEFMRNHFHESAGFQRVTAKDRFVLVRCRFDDYCNFQASEFHDETEISSNIFAGWQVDFHGSSFDRRAWFMTDEFECDAAFANIKFRGETRFDESLFAKGAWFSESVFSGEVSFVDAKFKEDILCRGARFDGRADFDGLEVPGSMWLESVGGTGEISLDWVQATGVVEVIGSFAKVSCMNAKFRDRVWFRLTGSELWLDNTAFAGSTTVESALAPPSARPNSVAVTAPAAMRLRSVKGTDAEHLTLVDVDLSRCEFAGLRRPELLHLVGRCRFAAMPHGFCWRWGFLPWHWAAREALFEEHMWRRSVHAPAGKGGWATPDANIELPVVPPERLAVIYRQLRKAVEDAKNEPGAADFYYGEMEMRRHSPTSPSAERAIIRLYWLISGYGLRAIRSLTALVIIGAAIATLLTGFGLAATAPVTTTPQHLVGTLNTTPGQPGRITGTLSGIEPQLPSASQRWTTERARTAAEVTLESFVFRSTDQPLTTAGTWTTIVARIFGPLLLALALLAIRNRVKR